MCNPNSDCKKANWFIIAAQWLSIDQCTWVARRKFRLIVWRSCLSVPQLLNSPSPLLTNRGTMLWDKLCWLLALLALSSGGLPPSNEPLSAPRIFLSFKGKALKILPCLWPSLFSSVFLYRHVDVIAGSHFCHQSFISWSCSLTGMGKLLSLAEFRAWQAWLFSPLVHNREFDCVSVRERRNEKDEEMCCWLSWLSRAR